MAPVFMLLEVIMDLFQPALMARIIDVGIANFDLSAVWRTGGLMILVAVIGMLGGVGSTIAASIAAMNMGADLRDALFRKVQSLSFANLDQLETGHLITCLTNDVGQVERMAMMSMRILVRAPLLIGGSLVMAILISVKLSSILLLAIPLLVLMVVGITRRAYPLFSKVQERLDRLNTVVQENLAGVRLVKAFARTEFEIGRFSEKNNALMKAGLRANRLVLSMMPGMMLCLNLAMLAVIWLGGFQVQAGELMVGDIMAYLNYLLHILFHLMILSNMLIQFSRAQASAIRVREVLDTHPALQDTPDASELQEFKGDLRVEDVSFCYKQQNCDPVLSQIDLHATSGQLVAIIGATGSGKSSLAQLIPRLYDVNDGRILLDGKDIRTLSQKSLKQHIALVQQQTILFSGTIRENICYGAPNADESQMIEAGRIAQAHDFIQRFPEGYDTELGQRGVNLSGGQKQRISLARALLVRPKILILDDSTSAVDLVTEARIQKALRNALQETICIIVAQRISSVREADKILVLDDGKIAAEGTHEELLAHSSIYQDIYASQALQ